MNASNKNALSSKTVQDKRKIWSLSQELSKGRITQAEHDIYKDLLEERIEITTFQHTRIHTEMALTRLVNHISRTFTTTQHNELVNKLNMIDNEIFKLRKSFNKNLANAKILYPNIQI